MYLLLLYIYLSLPLSLPNWLLTVAESHGVLLKPPQILVYLLISLLEIPRIWCYRPGLFPKRSLSLKPHENPTSV